MSERASLYLDSLSHKNPIPAGCRIGNLVMSSLITGRDPATGRVPPSLSAQCEFMFQHIGHLMAAAGGSTDDIIKVTVWLKDRSQRAPLNEHWLAMFPDPARRPARIALEAPNLTDGILIQCDITAWLGGREGQA